MAVNAFSTKLSIAFATAQDLPGKATSLDNRQLMIGSSKDPRESLFFDKSSIQTRSELHDQFGSKTCIRYRSQNMRLNHNWIIRSNVNNNYEQRQSALCRHLWGVIRVVKPREEYWARSWITDHAADGCWRLLTAWKVYTSLHAKWVENCKGGGNGFATKCHGDSSDSVLHWVLA